MAVTTMTIASLLSAFELVRPREAPTLRTVIKTIAVPYWRRSARHSMKRDDLESIPAEAIYDLLSADRTAWCPAIANALPNGMTYQKAYCRYIKRLVAFGEQAGALNLEHHLISRPWRELLALAYGVTATEPPIRRAALRSAFKRLARWATSCDLIPADLPIESPGSRPMAPFFETFQPDRDGDFYRARMVWNHLVSLDQAGGLRGWEGWNNGAIVARPVSTWPTPLQAGLDAIFGYEALGSWRPTTRRGYIQQIGCYLALLDRLRIDVEAVFDDVSDSMDSLRLLFQGLPSGSPKLSAGHLAAQLANSPTFRTELLTVMRSTAHHDNPHYSHSNPFLVEALRSLVEAGKLTSAINLVNKSLSINRGALNVSSHHVAWLFKQRTLLHQLARRQPSAYAIKKRTIFKHPTLWEDLVRARERLRAHTLDLEAKWRAAPASRVDLLKRRWAVALRNEVLAGLLLCYPLRASNLVNMRLGQHYHPDTHHIHLEAGETKNDKEIDYELPDAGSLGDLRLLVESYLSAARPILLAGRQSDYFFVPDSKGGVKLRSKGVNAILADTSRRFFADVLPAGVTILNPHLMRHATASYQLVVRQNLNLAAQLLNDSPTTVTRSYADVLACKKEATKRFLSDFKLKTIDKSNERKGR